MINYDRPTVYFHRRIVERMNNKKTMSVALTSLRRINTTMSYLMNNGLIGDISLGHVMRVDHKFAVWLLSNTVVCRHIASIDLFYVLRNWIFVLYTFLSKFKQTLWFSWMVRISNYSNHLFWARDEFCYNFFFVV